MSSITWLGRRSFERQQTLAAPVSCATRLVTSGLCGHPAALVHVMLSNALTALRNVAILTPWKPSGLARGVRTAENQDKPEGACPRMLVA